MSFQSAVKRTWLQYEKNASIPWTKSIREDLLANPEYPITLRDLRNAEFNPTFELSDNDINIQAYDMLNKWLKDFEIFRLPLVVLLLFSLRPSRLHGQPFLSRSCQGVPYPIQLR